MNRAHPLLKLIAVTASMIVDDLHILGASGSPAKTESPLIVYANAVLTLSITLQGFKSITGRRPQKIQRRCTIQQNSLWPQAATATVATSCYNSSDASYASHPALQARAC